jgi:hypothetical protein
MENEIKLFDFETSKMWDYENGFYLTSHPTRIAKLLAHQKLYEQIVNLPGEVLEFGVFKGASLIRLLTFRELFESPFSRKIIGFDMFGEFPHSGNKEDVDYAIKFQENSGTGIPMEELKKVFDYKGFKNYELIKGDILSTLPEYLDKNKHLRISFLHIDTDIYEPAKLILEQCYDRVVKNGIIVFDDYSTVAGETVAVDDFFKNKGHVIKKFPFSHIPSYIVK